MTRFAKKHILCHDSDIFLRYLIFVENKFYISLMTKALLLYGSRKTSVICIFPWPQKPD